MASEPQNFGLSFLRKQEPRLLDGPGFRIKCGMTARHFRHFSTLFTNLPSTTVESSLQIDPFLCKTKPIFLEVK
jgi:hypothetical protein